MKNGNTEKQHSPRIGSLCDRTMKRSFTNASYSLLSAKSLKKPFTMMLLLIISYLILKMKKKGLTSFMLKENTGKREQKTNRRSIVRSHATRNS